MRYEDTSGSISGSATPQAHDDADVLPNGSTGPATGNVITGAGTTTGKAGADVPESGHVVAVRGASGTDTSEDGGSLHVDGRFGTLALDEHGNYKYVADGHAPANFRDLFQYTLADSKGGRSVADLVISRGGEIQVSENAQKIVPNPDGTVTLPAGVDLNAVHVVGRDLVVDMPDGTQIVIVDGAVFVPQLVLGGVEVPSTNLAALLIDAEPKPAAGTTQSSGGNFAVPLSPLDPGVPLGDLIPPTELVFQPPEFKPVFPGVNDEEPTIVIQPDGEPASVAAIDDVNEKGLPTRGGEPAGSGEIADGNGANNSDASETTGGTIIINSPDGIGSVTINGVVVTGVVGQQITGDFGTLTVTGFSGQNILYSYTLADNTSGDNTHDDFSVTITDPDGDAATATLTIDIIDDVPTARPDTDAVAAGTYGPETGNVLTGAGTTSGAPGADTVGADDAHISNVTGAGSTTAGEGSWVVNGQYGVLTINDDGSYSYVRNPGTPGGVNDVFNYTLTDGDGDTSTTTLTISIGDLPTSLDVPTGEEAGTLVFEQGLPARDGEPAGSGEIADGNGANNSDPSESTAGTITFTPGDGPAEVTINGTVVTGVVGQTIAGDFGTLTIDSYDPNGTITYHYVLADNTSGDTTHDDFDVQVTDQDNDTSSATLVINIVDDVPTANDDTDALAAGTYGPETGNVISGAGTTSGVAGADVVGADDAHVSAVTGFNSSDSTPDGSGNLVVNGQYGVLTINEDGSYSYVRNAGTPGGVTDEFNYTLTDGDGDTSTATLTITIGDVPTSLDVPTGEEAGTLVYEAGLPTRNGGEPAGSGEIADGNGSNNSDPSERTDGTITFSPGDGPAEVTINGTVVTGVVGQTIAGAFGTLTIDSYDANGTITYHYVLADNTSGDNTHDDFDVQVTDQDGDSSSATLVINIVDDVPSATDDVDVIEGGAGPATGNVLTGVDIVGGDANGTDGNPDVTGADNGSITQIHSENMNTTDSSADGSGNFVINGQYGTLTINEDGSYSYTRTNLQVGGVEDVFTYTLTDGDGDTTTATLTVGIEDHFPTGGNVNVQLDDDALPGGNAGGTGDDADSVNASGTLPGSGGDGTLTFSVQTTGAPAGFTYVSGGAGIVLVQQNGETVLTVTVGSDGSYSVVQNNPIDHPTSSTTEDNVQFTINYTVTDADGDTAPGTISIDVDDDTPVAVASSAGFSVSHDETAGLQGDANDVAGPLAAFAGVANVGDDPDVAGTGPIGYAISTGAISASGSSYGADGAGSTVFSLNISSSGVDSGLNTTSGQDIFLFKEGGLIVGRVGGAGGAAAFAIAIDSATGQVSLVQYLSIEHTNTASNDESVSLTNGVIQATVTVTDHDGDVATNSVNIGNLISFQDDGPSAAIVTTGQTVSLDETAGNQGDSNDVTGPIAAFAGVLNAGDDPDVAGTVIQYATNANAIVASTGTTFGADGGSLAFSLNVSSSGVDSGLNTTDGHDILLYQEGGLIVGRVSGGADDGKAAFAIAIDSTGHISMVEYLSIQHPNTGNPDDSVSIANGAILAVVTATDGDGDTSTASIGIGNLISFQDDGPSAAIATTGQTVSLDESAGNQVDSNDVTGPIAAFAGVLNAGDDPDVSGSVIQYATNASAIVNSTGSSYGADGAGTTAFSLNVSSAGVDSGLNTTDGHDILLYKEGGLIVGRVSGGADDGKAAFAVAIDSTGHISMVEYLSIQHPDAGDPDDSVSIANGAIVAVVTVTDGDGDTSTASTPIGNLISFQDSAPIMTAADDINIQNTGDVAATGAFAFDLGADGAPTNNDVIKAVTGSATVNGEAVTGFTITEDHENSTESVWNISFDYDTGTGGTAHETGTLTFDKGSGTYTVDLDNPIEGFSILSTGAADAGDFVSYQVPSGGSGAPEVTVAQLDTDFFVQFSGVAEPGSGTGANNLTTTTGAGGDFVPVTTASFTGLELFTQEMSTVQISNTAAGVAGNTIQGGEVLDFNLYATDPGGTLGGVPTTSSTSMFIQLDGIGGSEDMIVVLKLMDTSTGEYTTKAIIVQNADILTDADAASLVGTAYEGLGAALDNNDGLIVIEANDYQQGNTNLVIVGAQIAGSDEGITGTGINLNGDVGDTGGSSGTQSFATDVSDAPFKITSIGFVTSTTTDQDAQLTFDVTVQDGDGDTVTQTITASVTSDPDGTTPISLDSSVTTISQTPLVTKTVAASSDTQQQTTTNSNSVLMGAFAAAGIAASESLAAETAHSSASSHGAQGLEMAMQHTQSLSQAAVDAVSGNHPVNDLMPALNGVGHAAAQAAAHASDAAQAHASSVGGNAAANHQSPSEFLHGTQAAAHAEVTAAPVTAASIAMPAAQQLAAAATANAGADGGQHNQVIGQVLAEALHGGSGGPSIDDVLASLPGHGGANAALEALASHNAAGVPMGDSAAFAAFTAAHSAFTMEAMVAHVDAVQSHA